MDNLIVKMAGTVISGLKTAAGSIAGRVMGGVGLTWVQFQYALPVVKQWLQDKFDVLPQTAVDFLSACGIDIFMVMIASAIVARVGLKTVVSSLANVQGMIDRGEAS